MPQQVEYFRWLIVPFGGGKPYLSRHAMTREQAAERHAGAVPDLKTRTVRTVPNADELPKQHRCGRDGTG